MKRRLVQALFVLLGLAWLGYTAFEFFISTYGDCFDEQFCHDYKSLTTQMLFWRGLCVAFILIFLYRVFRVEPEE